MRVKKIAVLPSLVASVFSPAYKVPDILVAETPALRKKTNSIRGTAGVRRKMLIKEIARQKSATKSKLTYMDPPLSPRRPEPAVKRPAEKKAEFVIPEAAVPSDDEVLVVVLSPWPLLTDCEQESTPKSVESAVPVARRKLPNIPRRKRMATDLNQASEPPSQPSQLPSQASEQPSQPSQLPSQSGRTTRASKLGSSQVRAVGSCHARPKNDLMFPQASGHAKGSSTSSRRRGGPE